MIIKVIVTGAFLLFGFNCLVFADNPVLEFEGRYWVSDLDAKARVVISGIGSDVNFKSDLGVKDEDLPEARIIWNFSNNSKLRLAYTQANYSGNNDLPATIEFKGKSYTAGTRVNSELDIKYLRFGWIRQFINIGKDRVRLSSILEAKGISADMSLEAPNLSPAISESEELLGGLPTLGLALDIALIEKVNIFAEASGLAAGDLGYFFDAETGIKLMPVKNLSIIAGFRVIDIKAKDDPDFAKIELTGPFVGATLKF